MSAIADVLGAIRRLASAIVRAPVTAYRYLVENASRALAVTWLAGMVSIVGVTAKRAIRMHHDDAGDAAEAAADKNGDGSGEVIKLMDVDEMNKIRDDQMHANGLQAAGDTGDPDQATIDAARAARARNDDPSGDQMAVGGDGKIVLVSKGGIAGWIQRNKGKTADPETLAWLRGEEAAEGRETYAGWADHDDKDLSSWLKHNRPKQRGGAAAGDQQAAIDEAGGSGKAGSGSATTASSSSASSPSSSMSSPSPSVTTVSTTPTATATATTTTTTTTTTTPTTTTPTTTTPTARTPPTPTAVKPAFDVRTLGTAAVVALTPSADVAQREADLAALRAKVASTPAMRALDVSVRVRRIVIGIGEAAFAGTELTADGKATIRQLATTLRGDVDLEVRGDPDRALELAGVLVVAGVDADRIALGASAAADRVEILISRRADAAEVP